MIKNRINFKLVNDVLFILAIFLIYQSSDLWIGIIKLIFNILLPFLIAFVIAYAFYPVVKKLIDKNIPKSLAILLVVGGVFALISIIIALITPTIMSQLTSLFNGIISFLKELSVYLTEQFGKGYSAENLKRPSTKYAIPTSPPKGSASRTPFSKHAPTSSKSRRPG